MLQQPESAIATWAVPENPISVEYPVLLLQNINTYVLEGFHRLSRGGMEVGGVLFGYRDGAKLRLETWRPISCEYSKGPCFAFSENDKADLERLLAAASRDPKLNALEPLGWFVSHTRSGLALLDTDQEIGDRYFTYPWHVALVLRPEKNAATRAGFFTRQRDGMFPASTRGEFTIDDGRGLERRTVAERPAVGRMEPDSNQAERRVAERRATPPPPSRPDGGNGESTAVELYAQPRQAPLPVPMQQAPAPHYLEAPQFGQQPVRRGHHWGRLVVILIVLAACAAAGAYYLFPPVKSSSFAFAAEDINGQLRIHWDRSAGIIRDATRGVLEINDGGKASTYELDAEHLRAGTFNYQRIGGDVDTRLTVYEPSGSPTMELSHFAGPPSVNSELIALRKERDRLQAEVSDLENQLEAEQRKTAKLEQMNKLKENLLQLDNVLSRKPGGQAPAQPPK